MLEVLTSRAVEVAEVALWRHPGTADEVSSLGCGLVRALDTMACSEMQSGVKREPDHISGKSPGVNNRR